MNTDQSTEKKAPDSESAVQVAPEHPLINVIMRQTDYSKELAVEKLKEHNNDVVSVVREYMNPPIQEVKNTKSTSQLIYGEIRSLMGSAATNYRIKKESEDFYLVKSDNGDISAYIEFLYRDADSLYGLPKLDKNNLDCYEIQWNFEKESKKDAASWTRIMGAIPKLINDFFKKNNVDVLYYTGLVGTKTGKLYSSENFKKQIEKMFSNEFRLYTPQLSAQPKFFLINKEIDTIDEINTIKEDINSKRYKHLTEAQILEYHNINKFPHKNIQKLKGIKRWEIIKEQIDRIILRRLYKIK
jgi:hypothetical protein